MALPMEGDTCLSREPNQGTPSATTTSKKGEDTPHSESKKRKHDHTGEERTQQDRPNSVLARPIPHPLLVGGLLQGCHPAYTLSMPHLI
jgi:hypothetical protein